MEKIWKDIPGYEGLYQVNNLGDIISLRKNCIMKPQKRKEYYRVRLLNENNIEWTVIIGEHLSYENERILQGKPIEFINEEVSDMAILIVEKEG